MVINKKLLNIYLENNLNVLLSGRHGVGKTAIIESIFTEHFDDKWAYFSASTMDAWVDFIGVPKPVEREDGSHVLRLIKPERFEDDDVHALFFDEFNRAPMKVRNAVMELMQFKSINGKKFKNLKVVWAAINPSDEEDYDVEDIDPAQLDRFTIQIPMPYKLDIKYFKNKYPTMYLPFCEWWNSLTEANKFRVSPRRLEEAIKVYEIGGQLSHVLPKEVNITELNKYIKSVTLANEWDSVQLMTEEELEMYFLNISNIAKFENKILLEFEKYIPHIPNDYTLKKLQTERDINWLKLCVKNEKYVTDDVKKQIVENVNKTLNKNKNRKEPANFNFIKCLQALGRFTIKDK